MGQWRSFGTAPELPFPPIELRVISVAARVDIAARRPSVPVPRHLAHPVGLLRGKIVHFGAIGRHVEELPRLLEARDEFPLAVADGAVSFMLPKDRLAARQRLAAKGGGHRTAFHRSDDRRVGNACVIQYSFRWWLHQ